MSKPLPLAIRKELLLARASLERAELARAMDRFTQAREPFERVARFASGLGGTGAPGGLAGVIAYARAHPYLGALLSMAAGRLRRAIPSRWLVRGAVVAAAAAGALWVINRRTPRR